MSSSRTEGCTLTGALSVTTSVRDAVSLIHGPEGCAHHNFSLLHALHVDNDELVIPSILSSCLREQEVIFGGECALGRAIARAAGSSPSAVFVLTSCVAAAIGDDVRSVCNEARGCPVVMVPTGGFLGGGFGDGERSALIALSGLARQGPPSGMVNLVGEKNLEYEAEANYREVARLLALLGVGIQLRFARNIPVSAIRRLGSASLNILRDESLLEVGSHLQGRFGTPYIPSFPVGFSGTLSFLAGVGEALGIRPDQAIASEARYQREIVGRFSGIRGSLVRVRSAGRQPLPLLDEIVETFDLDVGDRGQACSIPEPVPVGTAGLSRMLSRWQRVLHG